LPSGTGYPTSKKQKRRFLRFLRESGNVSRSAERAGFSRITAYRLRDADTNFATEWDAAIEAGVDDLEQEARRRAYEGVADYVVSSGAIVHIPQFAEDGKTIVGQKPLVRKRYSDTLMITLLKAHRPGKYREANANDDNPAQPNTIKIEFVKPPEEKD
jgi:hypothetical protein